MPEITTVGVFNTLQFTNSSLRSCDPAKTTRPRTISFDSKIALSGTNEANKTLPTCFLKMNTP